MKTSLYPRRNRFEMAAADLEANWNTPLERLKRATDELHRHNEKAKPIISKLSFEDIWL